MMRDILGGTGGVSIDKHTLEEGAPVQLHVRDEDWGKVRAAELLKRWAVVPGTTAREPSEGVKGAKGAKGAAVNRVTVTEWAGKLSKKAQAACAAAAAAAFDEAEAAALAGGAKTMSKKAHAAAAAAAAAAYDEAAAALAEEEASAAADAAAAGAAAAASPSSYADDAKNTLAGAVMFTCVGGNRMQAANFREAVPGVALGGGYMMGELGPVGPGSQAHLQTHSSVLGLFWDLGHEDEAPAPDDAPVHE